MTLRHLSLAGMLMLAGCPFLKTSTSSSTSSTSSGPSSSSPSSTPASEPPSESSSRSSEPEIVGLSIDDAKKKIKAHGFDGQIEVIENYEFDKDCKAETVCSFSPRRWYLNTDHQMQLYKNKSISVAVPE